MTPTAARGVTSADGRSTARSQESDADISVSQNMVPDIAPLNNSRRVR